MSGIETKYRYSIISQWKKTILKYQYSISQLNVTFTKYTMYVIRNFELSAVVALKTQFIIHDSPKNQSIKIDSAFENNRLDGTDYVTITLRFHSARSTDDELPKLQGTSIAQYFVLKIYGRWFLVTFTCTMQNSYCATIFMPSL